MKPSRHSFVHTHLFAIFMASAILVAPTHSASAISQYGFVQSYSHLPNIKKEHISIIYKAEKDASLAGKLVLRKARTMSLNQQKIIRGSCWDYLNSVFNNANVSRNTIFTAKKDGGRYFNLNQLQAGDWIYHTNLSYKNSEHSGMFVGWVDKRNKKALMLSYTGGGKNTPARYKIYDIRRTYNVMRPIAKALAKPIYNNHQVLKDFQSPYNNTVLEPLDTILPTEYNPSDDLLPKDSQSPYNNTGLEPSDTILPTEYNPSEDLLPKDFQPSQYLPNNASPNNFQHIQKPIFPINPPKNIPPNFAKQAKKGDKKYVYLDHKQQEYLPKLLHAERSADLVTKKALTHLRFMTVENPQEIIYDFEGYLTKIFADVNVFYQPIPNRNRAIFFSINELKSGDWIYYRDDYIQSRDNMGIFIDWVDRSQNKALILSYDVKDHPYPTRYETHYIQRVHSIKRPVLRR